MAEPDSACPDRLEQIVQMFAEGQLALQKTVSDLATNTTRIFDELAEEGRETKKRFRETELRFREICAPFDQSGERLPDLDEQINNLLRDIREFTRRNRQS